MAAVLVLMISSFSVGAIAFAREIPVGQETLELEGFDLTLILPDSWAGQYSVGVLFCIVCYEESMTEEQFVENGLDFTAYRYILSTRDKTYILHYPGDVQYDPADEEQVSIYSKMESEIKDIQFVVSNIFAE